MIQLNRFKKVNENCLINNHKQSYKSFENIDTNVGTLIGSYQSQKNNLTWFACRKSSHEIRIEVRDEQNFQSYYLDKRTTLSYFSEIDGSQLVYLLWYLYFQNPYQMGGDSLLTHFHSLF